MGIGVGTAIAVSAGASMIQGAQQKSAIEEAEDEQARLEQEAKAQEQRIFAQQAEDAKNTQAETVQFGIDDEDNEFGSYNDFLTPTAPTKSSTLGTISSSGLGF